jgi:hypothetical protein
VQPYNQAHYPLLLEEPVLLPELLLETTEMALAMASTADRRSANVFLSDRSASGIDTAPAVTMETRTRARRHFEKI